MDAEAGIMFVRSNQDVIRLFAGGGGAKLSLHLGRWQMSHLFRLLTAAGLLASVFLVIAVGLARHNADLAAPFHLFGFIILLVLYLVPTALALYRNCKATAWIAALNILLGWTLFGWAIAMGWSATGKVSAANLGRSGSHSMSGRPNPL